jgi:hypothetical protein
VSETDVWLVHGRNGVLARSVSDFLRKIGLKVTEFSEALYKNGVPCPSILDVVRTGFDKAHAFVILLSPDDVGYLRRDYVTGSDESYDRNPTGQARLNVIFEGGLACGIDPKRTIWLQAGFVRPFSDLAGIHVVRLENSASHKQDLVNRLKLAGCALQIEGGTAWLDHEFEMGSDALPIQTEEQGTTVRVFGRLHTAKPVDTALREVKSLTFRLLCTGYLTYDASMQVARCCSVTNPIKSLSVTCRDICTALATALQGAKVPVLLTNLVEVAGNLVFVERSGTDRTLMSDVTTLIYRVYQENQKGMKDDFLDELCTVKLTILGHFEDQEPLRAMRDLIAQGPRTSFYETGIFEAPQTSLLDIIASPTSRMTRFYAAFLFGRIVPENRLHSHVKQELENLLTAETASGGDFLLIAQLREILQ